MSTQKRERWPFTQRPNWLFESNLSPNVRETYTVLLSHAWNGDSIVYPSVDRIAKMARIGRTTTQEALNTLEAIGLISIDSRPPHRNRYTLRALNGEVSKAGIERICALSRAEIAALEASTRTSQNPVSTSRNPFSTSQIPSSGPVGFRAVDRSDSGHEAYEYESDEYEADEGKEDEARRRTTPQTPPASVECPSATVETSPAFGRGQGGGEEIMEKEMRIAAALSSPKYDYGERFGSLRRKLLASEEKSREQR